MSIAAPGVWESVRQLIEADERLRGTRALVPRGVYRFATFEEADRWMEEKIACTQARQGLKTSRRSDPR